MWALIVANGAAVVLVSYETVSSDVEHPLRVSGVVILGLEYWVGEGDIFSSNFSQGSGMKHGLAFAARILCELPRARLAYQISKLGDSGDVLSIDP